jgi:uncharacterized SAM-binding protein YcdF (DUF218 family)
MFNVIKAFLMQFANPLAFVGLVLFVTLFLIKKKPKTAIWFVIICLLIVAVMGNSYFATFMTRSMEWRYMPATNLQKADAVFLLAEDTYPAFTPRQRIEVGESADRTLFAAQLYQQEYAPTIVVLGNRANSFGSKTLLMELGVPENAIIVNPTSSNLRASIINAKEILVSKNFKTIILVTSALSMDRSLFLLRDETNVEVVPAPVDYQVTLDHWQALTSSDWTNIIVNLMPNAQAFNQTWKALWEYFGLAFYRVRSIF